MSELKGAADARRPTRDYLCATTYARLGVRPSRVDQTTR
jgi:hypothetical protein